MVSMPADVQAPAAGAARTAWRETFFSNVAPGQRSRSGTDAINLILGVITLGLTVLAVHQDPQFESWLTKNFVPPPEGLSWVLSTLFIVGTVGVLAVLILFAVLNRARDLLWDLALAFVMAEGLSIVLQWLFGTTGGRPEDPDLAGVNTGFPNPALCAVIAMAIVGRPYLARGMRQLVGFSILASFVGSWTTGRALPLAIAGSLLVGWISSCAVHLIRGRPRIVADPQAVAAALEGIGLRDVRVDVTPRLGQKTFGVDRLSAVCADGPLGLAVFGRDSRDAEIVRTTWRWISHRDTSTLPFVSRQQQAEHEALITTSVHDVTGGVSPALVGLASTLGARDVIVATRPPNAAPLRNLIGSEVGEDVLSGVARLVERAHHGHVSLGAIDLDRLGVDPSGQIVMLDPSQGALNPSITDLHRDVAAAITVMAILGDVDRSLRVAVDVLGAAEVESALSYLQRAALSSSLLRDAKQSGKLLAELQAAGAKLLNVETVELVPLRRVSGTTLVLAIGTLIGGWALIGVLSNVAASIETIKGADIAWVVLTAVVAQLVFPSLALADLGSVYGKLPYGRLVVLEVSNTFSGLAAGTVAVMAARVRFFQRQGYDATTAITSGVLISLVSWLVKGGLFLIALPFVWGMVDINVNGDGGGSNGPAVEIILLAIVAIAATLAVVLFVPRYRHAARDKLTPKVHETADHLRALAQHPRKMFQIFAGNTAAQLVIALALGASLHAFNASLSIAALIFVLTVGSVIGGIAPVPGGMGVVEAGMILALTWVGVPEDVAVAAVFVQRMFTAYLPPIWGYGCLIWMRRHDYI
jgi:uncharacterized membrane protein YbhN (UPF0104 family)